MTIAQLAIDLFVTNFYILRVVHLRRIKC